MPLIYSTIELIKILAEERQACLQGKRLNLSAKPGIGNPAIDCIIKPDGMQKFTAYQDFKAAVHQYQREHQVSGIVWRQITINQQTLNFPCVDDQLIALPGDLVILQNAKNQILDFWFSVTENMDLYLSLTGNQNYRMIDQKQLELIINRTEWANLWKWEKLQFLEILLQLGWGQPELAGDQRGLPLAGSEYIHAVKPGHQPIG